MLEAQLEQALAAGRAAVGVGVDDQLGAAAQRRVAGRVHVAEDHVGLEPGLDAALGAAVDGDEQRPHVADVGAQRLQVLRWPSPRTTISTWRSRNDGAGRRELDRAGQQVGLLADVRDVFSANSASASSIRSRCAGEAALELGDVEHLAAHLVSAAD